jgi:ribonucleoside-diphosphate reductase alpha chain
MKIKSIKIEGEILPTYDIEVPEIHHYNCEGLVSHNSSVVCNATNGIEPPRDYLSIKQSKKGTLKQIVPQYTSLKSNYTLLWDMKSNDGYINIVAAMQKFTDQGISANWPYNPEHYPNKEIPISIMVNDFLKAYARGWKNSYYQNTYDGNRDEDIKEISQNIDSLIAEILESDEGSCESCSI